LASPCVDCSAVDARGGRKMRPRFRLASADDPLCSTASLNCWTHQVGVTGGMRGAFTPTSDAIGLSSPVAVVVRSALGELTRWRRTLPLLGDEGFAAFVTGGGGASR